MIKATGRQGLASVCSLCCMLFIALPFGYFTAFYLKLGLDGLWLGYGMSTFCLSVLYALILMRLNWQKTAEVAASSEEISQSSNISMTYEDENDDDFKRI